MPLDVQQVARVCHETNRAYCETIGDFSQPIWNFAPDWQKESAIKGVQFHIAKHEAGEVVPASASHDSWLEEKRAAGWKCGPVKDADAKEHPCFVPYGELPVEQRLKDYLFGCVVSAFFAAASQ